jgi:hypothetical protein
MKKTGIVCRLRHRNNGTPLQKQGKTYKSIRIKSNLNNNLRTRCTNKSQGYGRTIVKKLFVAAVLLTALFAAQNANGQDIILKNDGSEIKAKVLEITDTQIKYKDFDFQDGPTRNILKTQVFRIAYENGKTEIFTKQTAPVNRELTQPQPQPQQNPIKTTTPEQPETPKEKKFEFSIYFGGALPLGNFAEASAIPTGTYKDIPTYDFTTSAVLSEDGYYGDATFGFNFGIKAKWILYKGLGLFISTDLFYNSTSKDLEGKVQKLQDLNSRITNTVYNLNAFNIKITAFPKYIHVPFMVGLNYTHNFNKTIGIWGEGSMGASINAVSNYKTSNNYYGTYLYYNSSTRTNIYSTKEEKEKYDASISLGYSTGAGILLFKRLSLGIQYFGRTSNIIKGESSNPSFYTPNGIYVLGSTYPEKFVRGRLSVHILTFRVGVHL